MLKPELQAKFLNHLNKKKKGTEGFTLIELLVVIIIIGVLAAIALPSLLNQVSKARQSEARQNVGAMNRAQQAYFLENSNKFTSTVSDLGVGIKEKTQNYEYTIAGNSSTIAQAVTNKGAARQPKLKSYVGVSYSIDQSVQGSGNTVITESLTQAFLCEAKNPNGGTADTVEDISGAVITSTPIAGLDTDTGGCKGDFKPIK